MKIRLIVLMAALALGLSVAGVAVAAPEKTSSTSSTGKSVRVTNSLLKQVAEKWKKDSDAGKITLNDPSKAPKLANETTVPSTGEKHYTPSKKRTKAETTSANASTSATTNTCPAPSSTCTPSSATPPPAGYPVYRIALINNGSSWSASQTASYATVMQDVMNTQHVYKWGVAGIVKPFNSVAAWQSSGDPSWPVFVDGSCSDCDGTAYHDAQNVNGICLPYSQVQDWPGNDDITENSVSHELLEMTDNPACNQRDRVVTYNNLLYLVEVADPVEDYEYPFEGHIVTDWQFPSYWQAGTTGPRNQMALAQNVLYPVCGPDYATTGDAGSDYQSWEKSQLDNYKYYDCLGHA